MKEELAKGFTCDCGEFHRFSPWVHAHWDIELKFVCPLCGRQYAVQRGYAWITKDIPGARVKA